MRPNQLRREKWNMSISATIISRLRENDPTLVELNLAHDRMAKLGSPHQTELMPLLEPLNDWDIFHLTRVLRNNTHLHHLNLGGNYLSQDQVLSILNALQGNTTLKILILQGCSLTDIEPILQAIDKTALTWIDYGARQPNDSACRFTPIDPAQANPDGRALFLDHLDSHHVLGANNYHLCLTTLMTHCIENQRITHLDISTHTIGYNHIAVLVQFLKKNRTLTSLSLNECRLNSSKLKSIIDALKENTTLTSLDLSHNQIDDNDLAPLTELFLSNQSLQALNLSRNRIKAIAPFITALEKTQIRRLVLMSDSLTHDSWLAIIQLLRNNHSLNDFTISHLNEFKPELAIQFIKAIETNTTLQALDLSYSHLGSHTVPGLVRVLENNKSLRKLNLYNTYRSTKDNILLAQTLSANTTLEEINLRSNGDDFDLDFLTALHVTLSNNHNVIHVPLDSPHSSHGRAVFGPSPQPKVIAQTEKLIHEIKILLQLNQLLKKHLIPAELLFEQAKLSNDPLLLEQSLQCYQTGIDAILSDYDAWIAQVKLNHIYCSLSAAYLEMGMKEDAWNIMQNTKPLNFTAELLFKLASAFLADQQPNYQFILILLGKINDFAMTESLIRGTFQSLKYGSNAPGLPSIHEQTGREVIISLTMLQKALELALKNSVKMIEDPNVLVLHQGHAIGNTSPLAIEIVCRNPYVRDELAQMVGVKSESVVIFEHMVLYPEHFPLAPLPPRELVNENPEENIRLLMNSGIDLGIKAEYQLLEERLCNRIITNAASTIDQPQPEPEEKNAGAIELASSNGIKSRSSSPNSFFAQSTTPGNVLGDTTALYRYRR